MRKKTSFILLLIIIGFTTQAQTRYQYSYDDAGNRYKRKYYTYRLSSDSLSTINEEQRKIEVFPNPVSDILTVRIDSISDEMPAKISLIDQSGKILLTSTQVKNSENIQMSSFKAGVYYISIWLDKNKYIYKLIKTQ